MAITYVGAGYADDGSAPTNTDAATPTLPTHQSGDVGYLLAGNSVGGASSLTSFNAISGWTSIGSLDSAVGTKGYIEVFRRVFTSASETNPSVNTASNSNKAGLVLVFRGVDNTTPEDGVSMTTSDNNNVTDANASITPSTNNGAIILFQYCLTSIGSNDITALGLPSTPSGLTGVSSGISTSFNRSEMTAAYDEDFGTAATITPTGWTHTCANSDTTADALCASIVLRPASGGTSTNTTIIVPTGPEIP